MAQAQFVNPLAGLQSKAPVQDNSALRKLQTAMAQQNLANRGNMDVTNAQGVNARKLELVTQMIPHLGQQLLGEEGLKKQNEGRIVANTAKNAKSFNDIRRGGGAMANPKQSFTANQVPELKFTGGAFPQAQAEKVKGELAAKLTRQNTKESIKDDRGKQVGTLAKHKDVTGSELTGKAKSVDPDIAKSLIDRVRSDLGVEADGIRDGGPDFLIATLNGKDVAKIPK